MRLLKAAIAVALSLGITACGSDDDGAAETNGSETSVAVTTTATTSTVEEQPPLSCEPLSPEAVRSLEASLRDGGRLRAARSIPAGDGYTGPADLRTGAYFIAANLDGSALTWLATKAYVDTGRGTAVSATQGTRRFSGLGEQDPDQIGVTPESRGFGEVRACVAERVNELEEQAQMAQEERARERSRKARAAERRARREARRARAAERQRQRQEAQTPDPSVPDGGDDGSAPSGSCDEVGVNDFPVPPGDPRDRDGDGIACES